ncbi:MAG TPA: hypothetical protein VFW87_05710 [Pirellulales bacterium]|nr:hypothetical protein [Pirellulales bacterium]
MTGIIDTRADVLVAAHVVAEFSGDFDDSPFDQAMESGFIDRGELPTLAESILHLDRVLQHLRRAIRPMDQIPPIVSEAIERELVNASHGCGLERCGNEIAKAILDSRDTIAT